MATSRAMQGLIVPTTFELGAHVIWTAVAGPRVGVQFLTRGLLDYPDHKQQSVATLGIDSWKRLMAGHAAVCAALAAHEAGIDAPGWGVPKGLVQATAQVAA